MRDRKPRFWSASILVLSCVLVAPAELGSQCPAVINTNTPVQIPSMMFTIITKTLSGTAMCVTTGQNAFGCGRAPTATMATMLIATNFGTANPFCSWSCTCGVGSPPHFTINTGDGLPVELLDFSIEEEAS